ncbi:ChaN family lipoprotein [Flavobacterium pallidum]|uniref:Iron-regulated protein n=1 Tax=Flavobacterium pallidum TaxID=2172098 RepID=A0A2S1SFJ2_9FLAO|nr:ChaN family lipoprotein [Flavobacterium pallidum]AWI25174.1 iron-regulated protein [Flavobacterium pallidum]
MKQIIFLCCVLWQIVAISQEKPAYRIFDKNGKETTYAKLLKAASKTEVVLFGEFHDNAISHWLELVLAKDLAEKKKLVLGAEMFEADNQKQLDQYLKNDAEDAKMDSTARLWPNYKTDYKPLVDFAKEKNFAFIATNIPRRFASLVYKKGFEALESLSVEEKTWMAPLPIPYDPNLPGYIKMIQDMGGHGGDNLPKAQAVKDAAMAYFILKNKADDSVFLHYNGSYHSDHFEGIYWYLKKSNPDLKIITISTVTQVDISKLEKENGSKADFILVIDEDVTKTY